MEEKDIKKALEYIEDIRIRCPYLHGQANYLEELITKLVGENRRLYKQ